MVGQVAAEAFGLDPARLTLPPLDSLDLPHVRAAMWAVDAELTAGGVGGPLAAESLVASWPSTRSAASSAAPAGWSAGGTGCCRGGGSAAVEEYIERSTSDGCSDPGADGCGRPPHPLPLRRTRQFKAATGLPPHQYVILRRVERAKRLLQAGTDLSLAEVALGTGFCDQSQFSRHFKRLVGVTPGQFRTPARIA